jgi:23S rRNA (adenine2503-C2)-methyltransferase
MRCARLKDVPFGRTRRVTSAAAPTALNFFDLDRKRLTEILVSQGWPPYVSSQLWEAVYAQDRAAPSEISTLSKIRRAELAEMFQFVSPVIEHEASSSDSTIKWLVTCPRTNEASPNPTRVETVWIPSENRGTLCVSSQVGCSLSCTFCHTGTQKLQGNLSAGEIAGQVFAARRRLLQSGSSASHRSVDNVVLMGQGEPGFNPTRVLTALRILTAGHLPVEEASALPHLSASAIQRASLPPHRITVSTAGIAPFIERLGKEPAAYRLAVSLHAPSDELRTQIMPINKTYPLEVVLGACATYVKGRIALLQGRDREEIKSLTAMQRWLQVHGDTHNGPRRVRVSFEYILLRGVNDSVTQADELAALLGSHLPLQAVHVNLLHFNAWPGAPYQATPMRGADEFQAALHSRGVHTTMRASRGADVLAACGQLKSSVEERLS